MFPQCSEPSDTSLGKEDCAAAARAHTDTQVREGQENGLSLPERGDEPDAALPAGGGCLLLRGRARGAGSGPVQRCE